MRQLWRTGLQASAASRPALPEVALRALERVCDLLLGWQERAQQRRHLESLSDHMLRDIGLSRADVLAETTKRFWER